LFPLILKYAIRKTQENIERQHQSHERNSDEMNVHHSQKKKNQIDEVGEYVDYEEIKD
jgi:hypothetical protein